MIFTSVIFIFVPLFMTQMTESIFVCKSVKNQRLSEHFLHSQMDFSDKRWNYALTQKGHLPINCMKMVSNHLFLKLSPFSPQDCKNPSLFRQVFFRLFPLDLSPLSYRTVVLCKSVSLSIAANSASFLTCVAEWLGRDLIANSQDGQHLPGFLVYVLRCKLQKYCKLDYLQRIEHFELSCLVLSCLSCLVFQSWPKKANISRTSTFISQVINFLSFKFPNFSIE